MSFALQVKDKNIRAFILLLSVCLLASYLPAAFWLQWLADDGATITLSLFLIAPIVLYIMPLESLGFVVGSLLVLIPYLFVVTMSAWLLRRHFGIGLVVAFILFIHSFGQALVSLGNLG